MTEVLVYMEQNDLSITTTDTDFIISNCLNAFYSLSTNILGEDHNFIFNLEAAEITTLGSCKQEFFIRFAEDQAWIVTDISSSVD